MHGGVLKDGIALTEIRTAKENGLDPFRYLTYVLIEACRQGC